MTPDFLKKCMPKISKKDLADYCQPLTDAMAEFGISTPQQQAAFLATISHETLDLLYKKELASGEAYDTGKLAANLGNTPEKDGDGQKYKGRGPIQTTGAKNYKLADIALKLDLVNHPELLEIPINGCRASAFFWTSNGINKVADDFRATQVKVNGTDKIIDGVRYPKHWPERQACYSRILKVFGL